MTSLLRRNHQTTRLSTLRETPGKTSTCRRRITRSVATSLAGLLTIGLLATTVQAAGSSAPAAAASPRSVQWRPYRPKQARSARAASPHGLRLAQDTSGQSDPFENLFGGDPPTESESTNNNAPLPGTDVPADSPLEEIAPSESTGPSADLSPPDTFPEADLSVPATRRPAPLAEEGFDGSIPDDDMADPFEDDPLGSKTFDGETSDELLPLDSAFDGPASDRAFTDAAAENCLEALNKLRQDTIDKIVLSTGIEGQPGQDFPYECSLSGDRFVPRQWAQTIYTWKASGLCHKPLYFEDEHLERYGHTWGPYAQPFVSGAHFFATLPVLPYKMGLKTPNECVYALGHYRPGSCAPYTINPIPFTWRAALFEAGAVAGAVVLVP